LVWTQLRKGTEKSIKMFDILSSNYANPTQEFKNYYYQPIYLPTDVNITFYKLWRDSHFNFNVDITIFNMMLLEIIRIVLFYLILKGVVDS